MSDVKITIKDDGPYIVKGPIDLRDAAGNPVELPQGSAIALCRCGASTTKPFCDGTHSKVGFAAAGAAVKQEEE